MSHQPKILIADDDPAIARLLKSHLEPLEAEILLAADGHEALEIARSQLPDIVLLDVMMPGRSGWDVCQAIKGVRRTRDILIVLITGRGDVRDRLTGLQAGADDYLVKPFEKNDVTWRVSRLLNIAQQRREDGEREIEDEVDDLLEDPVTGLPAVSLSMSKVREMLIERQTLGILHVDIEQFERIEEEYGWAFFDEFLRRAAEVIRDSAESIGAIASINRVGSSAFFLFVPPVREGSFREMMEREARELQDILNDSLRERFRSLSSGEVAFFVGSAIIDYSPQIRLERQIYRGLQLASDAVRQEEKRRKQQLVDEMREIIRNNSVKIVFQPIVAAADCTVYGYELLTRGPESSSFRNSDMLFAFARENGMAWDLEKVAIEAMVRNLRAARGIGDRKCLINLEAETLEAFAENFDQMVTFFAENPSRFVFELTERAWIEDYAAFRDILQKLRERGAAIAIDDAGSGYASLEAIASLAPDYLKITKGLISTIGSEPIKQDLMKLLVELAGKIGAKTIAEGIETQEEYQWCRELGIDLLQGFYLARPSEDFVEEIEVPAGCEPLVGSGRSTAAS